MTSTIVAAPTDPGGLVPARDLPAQVHALHALAAFLDHTGIPGLSVALDRDRITVQVPTRVAGPAARAALVARLASATGGQIRRETHPGPTCGWVFAEADLAGHQLHIFTPSGEAHDQ